MFMRVHLIPRGQVRVNQLILIYRMNQLNTRLTWGLISLQGLLLLVDPSARNHIYTTFAATNSVSIPFLQSFSENFRLIISFALLPSLLYPRSWVVPKFATMVAYVFYICLHSNLILYRQPTDVKYLLFQLLLLGKALFLLVDDMLDNERAERVAIRRQKSLTRQSSLTRQNSGSTSEKSPGPHKENEKEKPVGKAAAEAKKVKAA